MQNEPSSGYTYELRLTPIGGGSTATFPCTGYNPQNHRCTATVAQLSMTGAYHAVLAISASGQTYTTPMLDSAFTVNAPAGGGMCLTGASVVSATGTGTCLDAYKINLSGAQLGSRWYFTIPSSNLNNETDGMIGGTHASGACVAGTGRDIVLGIQFPGATQVGTISAEGAAVDPIISVSSDNACGQIPLTACSNSGAVNECETVNVLNPGSTEFYYVISEAVSTGEQIIVSLTSI
jgi:hypothetical protein